MLTAFLARTSPGPGADLAPSETPTGAHLKLRSIPNVDTDRLIRTRAWLHVQFHTADGLRGHDEPRRQLANAGVRIRMISHELALRGIDGAPCDLCRVVTVHSPFAVVDAATVGP